MSLAQITDHAARAASRVVTHLRGTEFESLVRAIADEVQILEDALFSLVKPLRDASDAEGVTLDRLGALVGAEVRGNNVANTSSMPDAMYRTRVAAAVVRNVSWCSIENAHQAVLAFFPWLETGAGGPGYVVSDNEGAGCVWIKPDNFEIGQYIGTGAREAEEFMRYLAAPAGVRVIFTYSVTERDVDGTLARFDYTPDGFDSGAAFVGSVDQNTRN